MTECPPDARRLISITMPARNEEGNLPRAYDEVTAVMARLPRYDYEVIVIDNASTDRTPEIARGLCAKDPRWKYVRFSRNFGGETSLTIGLRIAKGDAVINLFSDLQDPTERIPDFIAKWEEGYDVVSGILQGPAGQQPAARARRPTGVSPDSRQLGHRNS